MQLNFIHNLKQKTWDVTATSCHLVSMANIQAPTIVCCHVPPLGPTAFLGPCPFALSSRQARAGEAHKAIVLKVIKITQYQFYY
jgi:hypothetical protein